MKRFYEQSVAERRALLLEEGLLDADEWVTLAGELNEDTAILDLMSENVIGAHRLPMGLLRSLVVDGVAHCVPMVTEEPSVVAAANRVSRLFNAAGGVSTVCSKPSTMVQVLFTMDREEASEAARYIIDHEEQLIALANAQDPVLIGLGGGAYHLRAMTRRIRCGDFCTDDYMVELALDVYTVDAMGANIVNAMGEALKAELEKAFSCFRSFQPGIAIVSNDGRGRSVRGTVYLSRAWLETYTHMDGSEFGKRIKRASDYALCCSERAVTHNKGILNGIEAAAIAFGQDTRALHAAAWCGAYRCGDIQPLAIWQWDETDQILKGQIELPLVVGFAGKFRKIPWVNAAFKLARIERYDRLCGVLAAVGLAQNLGALWALVTEGIQSGHMRLHAKKV